MKAALGNTLWLAACFPEWRRFQQAVRAVEQTQAHLLRAYLRANCDAEYGRRFRFASLASVKDYQRRAPLTTYDDYTDYVERLAQGQPGVLTAQPVRRFELSSGSTAASKMIPYTSALKAEFQRGLAPWIYDLYTRLPSLKHGPAYWSITPLSEGSRATRGGIPIGFEEDSDYLGPLGRYLVKAALAVPDAVKYLADAATFRYVTLLFLLRQPGLRLISVWNPTYLSLLLAPLPEWWDGLCADIASGTLTPPGPLAEPLRASLLRHLRPDPRRAQALRALPLTDYRAIWPRLALLSCWADGPAAIYARRLSEEGFPHVLLQGKGLLATEAFVSFPLFGVEGAVLAVTSHFFEFIPTDEPEGWPRLAHQLEPGRRYAVVVTTGGGLYRYQLHDVVEVVGCYEQAPCLRFVGKADHISDWFGEKLNEQFVAQALERIFAARGLTPAFALLAPDEAPDGFRYTLYLDLPPTQAIGEDALQADLERSLRQNFHYAYCRKLGQLAASRVRLIAAGGAEAYLRARQSRGQKLGNVKPAVLQHTTGWGEYFERLRRELWPEGES